MNRFILAIPFAVYVTVSSLLGIGFMLVLNVILEMMHQQMQYN